MSLESAFRLLFAVTCIVGVAGVVNAVRFKMRELAERSDVPGSPPSPHGQRRNRVPTGRDTN